jgi:hypothetical protein
MRMALAESRAAPSADGMLGPMILSIRTAYVLAEPHLPQNGSISIRGCKRSTAGWWGGAATHHSVRLPT